MTADDWHITLQIRCVHCLQEHYAADVPDISYGEKPCHSCGKTSRTMTRAEYLEALTDTQARIEAEQCARRRLPRQRRPKT